MPRALLLVCILVLPGLGLLASCGDPEPVDDPTLWSPTTEGALTLVQKQQRKRAFAAKDAMFRELSQTLMASMLESGPAVAIEVCRSKAPEIAAKVSKDRDVKIGRTSHRLRNPGNRPPVWATELVVAANGKNAYVLHQDGRFGALLPIKLQNACLTCHGDPSKIAPEVKATLHEHYPTDEATGFAAGDLRGWFWVEVPAVRTVQPGR